MLRLHYSVSPILLWSHRKPDQYIVKRIKWTFYTTPPKHYSSPKSVKRLDSKWISISGILDYAIQIKTDFISICRPVLLSINKNPPWRAIENTKSFSLYVLHLVFYEIFQTQGKICQPKEKAIYIICLQKLCW